MKAPLNLVFDVDDTLLSTRWHMAQLIRAKYPEVDAHDDYFNDGNTNGELAPLLQSAEFMRDTPLAEHTDLVFKLLPSFKERGCRLHICTHRGYHRDGMHHTMNMLEKHNVKHLFENVFCLNSKEFPDKVAYLDSVLGKSQYTLFDDNPNVTENSNEVPPHVILIDQPWNKHMKGYRITHLGYHLELMLNQI